MGARHRKRILSLRLKSRLPSMYSEKEAVEATVA